MDPIWKENKLYLFGRRYVDWCTRTCYAPLKVKGMENIPSDGPVIIASNHCNTLMDALVILQSRREATAFGARADIFRNKKVAGVLKWLRILPLARHRDTLEERAKNAETFNVIVDCVGHGTPFVIFPEGTHRMKRSLLPLKRGVHILAQMAAKETGGTAYIVPAGIEYDDYLHIMVPATLTFGEPIPVYGGENHTEIMDLLKERISSLITYFPDDENYAESAEKFEEEKKLKRSFFHYLLAAVLLPLFLLSGILCAPIWITTLFFGSRLKDKAWMNTVRFSSKLLEIPLLTIIYGILGIIFLPWWGTILLLLGLWYSHSIFYYILNFYRKLK